MNPPGRPGRRGRTSPHATTPGAWGGRAVVGFDGTEANQNALSYAGGWAHHPAGAPSFPIGLPPGPTVFRSDCLPIRLRQPNVFYVSPPRLGRA